MCLMRSRRIGRSIHTKSSRGAQPDPSDEDPESLHRSESSETGLEFEQLGDRLGQRPRDCIETSAVAAAASHDAGEIEREDGSRDIECIAEATALERGYLQPADRRNAVYGGASSKLAEPGYLPDESDARAHAHDLRGVPRAKSRIGSGAVPVQVAGGGGHRANRERGVAVCRESDQSDAELDPE